MTIKTNDGLWALEWSHRQNAFHVSPLDRMLDANRDAYTDNVAGDYRTIHIGYREEVEAMADSCRQTLAARSRAEA